MGCGSLPQHCAFSDGSQHVFCCSGSQQALGVLGVALGSDIGVAPWVVVMSCRRGRSRMDAETSVRPSRHRRV
jgi:hypothetical protein